MRGGATAVLALGLLLLTGAARAGENLADVMVEAYLNSPDIAAQRADIKAAAERAIETRAQGRLQVDGNIGLSIEARNSDNALFPVTLSLTATQPLYTGGQVENATEAAETRIQVEDSVLRATEQSVLLQAVTAFLDVRRDGFLLDVAQNNVRVLTEQLRAANARFEVGEVTRTDVEQARAALAAAQSRLASTRGQLEVSRANFEDVVGRKPSDLDPPPPIPDLPESLEAAVQLAIRNQPNIGAARLERVAAGYDVRTAIGALLPQLSLQGELSEFDTLNDGLGGRQTASIGLNLTIPFYSGGGNYAAVRRAQAVAENADATIIDLTREAVRTTSTAWADLEVARASIEAGRLEVRAARLAFEGVTEEAKVGARTTLDVLDAEEDVLSARASLISAQRDEYVAAYTLLSAIGLLSIDHLGLDVGDRPAAADYYESVRDRNFGYDQSDDTVWSLSYRP